MTTVSTRRRAIAGDLVAACRAAGTTHLFGVPGGGSNLDVVGVAEEAGIRFVLVHGETAGAMMAAVTGELTGAPGLCVATRGPGAASAVNGAAQALLDRQPMVVVTDCVAHGEQPRISHQRLAQQALMGPVTKASVVLDGVDPVAPSRIVELALAPRPGPVHVDIDPGAPVPPVPPVPSLPPAMAAEDALERARELVRSARRPVAIVGVGALAQPLAARHDVMAGLEALSRRVSMPVLTTYKARGIVTDASGDAAGVVTGATIEAPALGAADLILGIGLDPVELIPARWPYGAPVVLLGRWPIDDSTYFGEQRAVEVIGDVAGLVRGLTPEVASTWPAEAGQRFRRQANAEVLAAVPAAPTAPTPQQVVVLARDAAAPGTVATVDAGAHMFAALHLWDVDGPSQLLTSSGLATMGYALPAAIAAGLVDPSRSVVCFTGDGGLGMVLAELETLARLALPVVVVVFNDSALSLIAAKQRAEGQGGETAVRYRSTDFAAVARGCGVDAVRVTDADAYRAAVASALRRRSPALIDVTVDASAYGALVDAIRGPRR